MNRLDINQSGGFPLSTQILDAMQQAYYTTNQFGHLAGNLVIATGCFESNNTVSDGYVIINGELLFFKGSTVGDNVIIVELPEEPQRGFEDGSAKSVIYERYATFGSGNPSFPWSSFRRPLTLLQIEDRIKTLEKTTPIGLVAIWGRPADEIPPGWVEHTDMQGYVPVGHKSGDVNFGTLDANIGTAQVTLDVTQIPAHSHKMFGGNGQANTSLTAAPNSTVGWDSNQGGEATYRMAPATSASTDAVNGNTSKTGGGQSHSNIQPSRIVKFIRFVGF